MRKLTLFIIVLAAAGTLAQAQGLVSTETASATVYTNGTLLGEGTGPVVGASGAYYFDALDMTGSQWNSLSGAQQSAAANLMANPSAVDLWTDSGVTGLNSTLHAGGHKCH
jgi:hypothetical protein